MSIHHNFTHGTACSDATALMNGTASTDGSPALAASRRDTPGMGGSLRDGATGQQPALVQDNVVELYPGCRPPRTRQGMRLWGSEAGMATAEYAIATLAAVGFAGLLVFILRSDEVRGFLLNLIRTALALP